MKKRSFSFILLILIIIPWGNRISPQLSIKVHPSTYRKLRNMYYSNQRTLPQTPLSSSLLNLLSNEISGQVIFNNEVKLAGAPWKRDKQELTETFSESSLLHQMVKKTGLQTTKLEQFDRKGTFDYPMDAELWIIKPKRKLIARLDSDAALLARGSQDGDITGELFYLSPLHIQELKTLNIEEKIKKYGGKIALMWSHPYGSLAKTLDEAGIQATISFSSRDRYLDPDQVVYSGGSFNGNKNLKMGMTISWRQWSELLEDIENTSKLTLNLNAKTAKFKNRFETVYSWIPGTEPDKKGIIFTAHLFEGYTKRGANDNMSGCVVQLEILRAINSLIEKELIPRPKRTIYFLWPNEISGTYEHFKQHPGFEERISANINMDMVGEALRKNNAIFTMTECPNYLPSYLDGLGKAIMNWVWRGNDIVYLPDSPRGRRGQHFPNPLWEKNGSKDAFRYYLHLATGGSDHICFRNPSIGVPAIELNIWPDQWYHADTDTPDKSDPTQLKRTAFIGAAMALAAADCTDSILERLVESVSDYGFERIGQRELPKAFNIIKKSTSKTLVQNLEKARNIIMLATNREMGALESIRNIYSGTEKAEKILSESIEQWKRHQKALFDQIRTSGEDKAKYIHVEIPSYSSLKTEFEQKYSQIFPSIHPKRKGKEFSMERSDSYKKYRKAHPDTLKRLGINRYQKSALLNYINGHRSIFDLHKCVQAETGQNLSLKKLAQYIKILESLEWITLNKGD